MKNKIVSIIEENLVNYQSPNSGQGYDWHNKINPMQMSLVDILKTNRGEWEKAKKVLPYQIQTVFDRIISLYDNNQELKTDFIKSYNNPMIKDNDDTKTTIKNIILMINEIDSKYKDIISNLNKLEF